MRKDLLRCMCIVRCTNRNAPTLQSIHCNKYRRTTSHCHTIKHWKRCLSMYYDPLRCLSWRNISARNESRPPYTKPLQPGEPWFRSATLLHRAEKTTDKMKLLAEFKLRCFTSSRSAQQLPCRVGHWPGRALVAKPHGHA